MSDSAHQTFWILIDVKDARGIMQALADDDMSIAEAETAWYEAATVMPFRGDSRDGWHTLSPPFDTEAEAEAALRARAFQSF